MKKSQTQPEATPKHKKERSPMMTAILEMEAAITQLVHDRCRELKKLARAKRLDPKKIERALAELMG